MSPQLTCDWAEDCLICSTKPSGLCRTESETGKTARIRVSQHVDDMRSGRSSYLREHNEEYHSGLEPEYRFEVVRKFPGDPLG